MEAILRDQIIKHLETYNIIRDSHNGFRKGGSCLTNLLYFYEDMHGKIDNKKPVEIIYLDFEKYFDKVPHKRLMENLNGKFCAWIEDLLQNINQRVVIKGKNTMS